jgi:hypothetical protein
MDAVRSRPIWKDRHDNRVTGLRLSGDRGAGAARAVDALRNWATGSEPQQCAGC